MLHDALLPKDANGLPATYQAPLSSRLVSLFWLLPLYLLAMFERVHVNTRSPLELWIFAFVSLLLLVWSVLSTGFCKVTLYPDRIERETWFGKKTIKKHDIGDMRNRNYGLSMLCYKYNKGDGIVIPRNIGDYDLYKPRHPRVG